MKDRKIAYLVTSVIIYWIYVYAFRNWYNSPEEEIKVAAEQEVKVAEYVTFTELPVIEDTKTEIVKEVTKQKKLKTKAIQRYLTNACSAFEVFTTKPLRYKTRFTKMESDSNTIAVFGCILFLMILTFSAILDVIKAKEDERVRLKQNPEGERRQSLSEFANKKPLRRESSKFGLQLFQIAETPNKEQEEKQSRRQARAFTRGESTNSYLSERNMEAERSPSRSNESPTREMRLVKRQSVARLFGARPAPMVRRSSFPALPLNPEIQALMLGNRRPSVDSDEDSDGKGRRVRIIRRY